MTTSVAHISLRDKLKTIPGFFGLRLEEEPKFFVLLKDGNIQIRKYYSFLMAQTFVRGNFDFSSEEGFYRLTNYIFGSNTHNQKLEISSPVFQGKNKKFVMAAPVLHEQKMEGWMMSFILPAKYKFETLPKPVVNNIEIIKVPPLLVATLRYNGTNNEIKIKQKTRELIDWLETKEDIDIISEPRFAQYDPPRVLPFLRRNEIHITIKETEKKKHLSH